MKNNISIIIISVVSLIAVVAIWFLKSVEQKNSEVQKIAYVNTQDIISEYNYIKEAEKSMKLMSDDLMPKRDSIMAAINKLCNKYYFINSDNYCLVSKSRKRRRPSSVGEKGFVRIDASRSEDARRL